jgi:hypothetical protein
VIVRRAAHAFSSRGGQRGQRRGAAERRSEDGRSQLPRAPAGTTIALSVPASNRFRWRGYEKARNPAGGARVSRLSDRLRRGLADDGDWKLNEAKSKISPGSAKNHTVVYTAMASKVRVTVDGTDPDGKATHNEWIGAFDGKEYPVTEMRPRT